MAKLHEDSVTRGAASAAGLCPCRVRETVIRQSKRANVGHIGSALSIADLIAVLYADTLRITSPEDPDRDRFILSKGHASLALYAALQLRGFISEAQLDTFCTDGSLLGVHPEHGLRGVEFSTGSLGHGLPIGAGLALAARLDQSQRRIYVLVSDAECNEGSLWEAVMFAAHHKLDNLVAIVDMNGQQALGNTRGIVDLDPLEDRWSAFGWETRVVDGHDRSALARAFEPSTGRPLAVIARTVFGRGISYMEGQLKWHYWPMSDEQYGQALREVAALRCDRHSSAG